MKKICTFMLTLSLCFLMVVSVMGCKSSEICFISKILNENSEIFNAPAPANSHSVSSADSNGRYEVRRYSLFGRTLR